MRAVFIAFICAHLSAIRRRSVWHRFAHIHRTTYGNGIVWSSHSNAHQISKRWNYSVACDQSIFSIENDFSVNFSSWWTTICSVRMRRPAANEKLHVGRLTLKQNSRTRNVVSFHSHAHSGACTRWLIDNTDMHAVQWKEICRKRHTLICEALARNGAAANIWWWGECESTNHTHVIANRRTLDRMESM